MNRPVLLCAALSATSLAAQSWTPVSTTSDPGNVRDGAMAGHLVTADVIQFGGWPALGQTWAYRAQDWVQLTPTTAPPARRENAMADDVARGRLVMFGGLGASGVLGDTWEWDGTDWTLASPATSPPARQGHVMAYDSARQVTVLFGGTTNPNAPFELTDTWEWDGTTWTSVATASAPSESYRSSMCFDPIRNVCVLTGGTSLFGAPDQSTWEYDGVDWTNVTATVGPAPSATPGLGVMGAAMAFDLATGASVLYGGRTPNGTFSTDTFAYDGSAWTIVQSGTPSSRTGMMIAANVPAGNLVVYGGATGNLQTWFRETWEFAGGVQADYLAFGQGCVGSGGVPQLQPLAGSLPRSNSVFTLELTNLPAAAGLCYLAFGFDDQNWNGASLPLGLAGFGMPGCTLYTAIDFGATQGHGGSAVQWLLSIPSGFDGLVFYVQAAVFDPLAGNAAGVTASDAGRATVGS